MLDPWIPKGLAARNDGSALGSPIYSLLRTPEVRADVSPMQNGASVPVSPWGYALEGDVVVAQALADVATIAILQQRAALQAHVVADQLNHALNSRVLIEQAKGVIAGRAQLDMDQAFSWLRHHARDHNLLLVDVAQSVIDGNVTPEPPRVSRG
jgi:hypothetical protein